MNLQLNLTFNTDEKSTQAFADLVKFLSSKNKILFSTVSDTGENQTIKFSNWTNYHRSTISSVDFMQRNRDHTWVQYYAMEMTSSPDEFINFALSRNGLNQSQVIEIKNGQCWIHTEKGRTLVDSLRITAQPQGSNYFKFQTAIGEVYFGFEEKQSRFKPVEVFKQDEVNFGETLQRRMEDRKVFREKEKAKTA